MVTSRMPPVPRKRLRMSSTNAPTDRSAASGRVPHRAWLGLLLLGLVLGFAFQGTRALWNTDEGRYTGNALQMIDSGNYLVPYYSTDRVNFTKPPVTYWAIAASLNVFGHNTWAARTPNALAFVLTILLVFGMGRVLVPDRPWLPALVYACSLGPFFAANVVSTDDLLTLFEALAMFGFVRAFFGTRTLPEAPRKGVLLMWLGFGLAFLTKGPPGLLPLLGVLPFVIHRDGRTGLKRLFWLPGVALFLVAGLAWYAVVMIRTPGLLDYYLKDEIYNRIFTGVQNRNPQWYGWIRIYGLVFLVGTLPWWGTLLRGLRHVCSSQRLRKFWKDASVPLFLLLWFVVPLVVFCIAKSRLWSYVLPLFVPLALLLARVIRPGFNLSTLRQRLLLGAWIVVMLSLKAGVSYLGHPRADDRQRAAELSAIAAPGSYQALSFVQDTRHGVKIEEHTPWGMRLYLDKPLYGVAWNAKTGIDRVCTELRRHRSVLYVLDAEIDVASFRAALSKCDVAGSSALGTWRHRGLVRAWTGTTAAQTP